MSALFAELYLDEDVDVTIARLLEGRGFQATTTRDAGRLGATDEEQLEYAASHGLVLVTHNRVDFEALHEGWLGAGREHAGMVVLARQRTGVLVATLSRLLNRAAAEEFVGLLLYG